MEYIVISNSCNSLGFYIGLGTFTSRAKANRYRLKRGIRANTKVIKLG